MSTTAALPRPRPFLPSDIVREPPGRAVTRAIHSVVKAAVSPASTPVSSWAGVLSGSIVADFVAGLAPTSAAAKLISSGLRVSLDGVGVLNIPHRTQNIAAIDTQWIGELSAFPVKAFSLTSSAIGPTRKLISSVVVSRELAESSNGEEVVGQLLSEDIGASLDASVFSATAASSLRPAGILNGIAPLTATAGGGEAALRGDLALVAGAVAAATGAGDIALVASPAYALRLQSYPTVIGSGGVQVWPSVGVANGVLIAVQTKAFVSAFGATPRITASKEAVVHMEDTSPLPIATGAQGSGVLATPTSSMFQTDCIAVRAILDAAWAIREPGSVAWTQTVTW